MSQEALLDNDDNYEMDNCSLSKEEFYEVNKIVNLNMPLREKPLIELFPILRRYKIQLPVICYILTCGNKRMCC